MQTQSNDVEMAKSNDSKLSVETALTNMLQSDGDVTQPDEMLKKFAEETTMHGFKELHQTRGIRRVIWLIGLLMTTTLVVLLFRESIADYLTHKTYIDYQVKEDIHSLPFPTVTLCFTDTFLRKKYDNFPVKITLAQYARLYAVAHGEEMFPSDISLFENLNITSYETLIKAVHISPEDVTRNTIGKIFNHYKRCSFSKQDCTEKDIKQVWMFDGKHSCLQFNGYEKGRAPRRQNVIFSPFRVYLDMESNIPVYTYQEDDPGDIDVHDEKEEEGHIDKEKAHKKFKKGFSFHYTAAFIHDYGIPHHLYYGKSTNEVILDVVKLVPGAMTQVNLHLHTMTQLPEPYGTCGSNKLKVLKSYRYSMNACALDCLLEYVIKQCGCIRFDMKELVDNVPVCTTSQMVRCYFKETKIASKKSSECCGACLNLCSRECTRVYFNMQTARQPPPSHHDGEVEEHFGWTSENRSLVKKYIKDHIFGIEVRYWRMKELQQIYTPVVSLTMLIGTIGGCIGLGMGVSILTVIQIITFIVDAIKNYINLKMRQRKQASNV